MQRHLSSLVAAKLVLCALAGTLPMAAYAEFRFSTMPSPVLTSKIWSDVVWYGVNKRSTGIPRNANGLKKTSTSEVRSPIGASNSLDTGQDFATARGLEQLVATYPQEDQPRMVQVYKKLILAFNDTVPRAYGLPKNNLATAYTAVLTGSYAAYTHQPFPDDAVQPLYRQMERLMRSNPKLDQASMNDKATLYQVWVGLGMFMLAAQAELAQHPDPQQQAQLQKAGADSLRTLLGVEPDKVRFTANGMKFL